MRTELLHFEGCPGSAEVLDILEGVVVNEEFAAEVFPVISDPDDRSDFLGSPTILVNSEDLFPAGRGGSARHELQDLRHPRRSEEPSDRADGTRGVSGTVV